MNWYDNIENNIRPIVKLLRDNGFNTTCSCGHTMYVELEMYCDGDLTRLWNLLTENNYKFTLIANWNSDGTKGITVHILKRGAR